MPLPKRLNRNAVLILSLLALTAPARASDFRLGVALGFGGTGINTTATVIGQPVPVSRSEGPGTFDIFFEYLLSEQFSLGIESSRGFRLGPFSSGEAFTGLAGRWFWNEGSPTTAKGSDTETVLLVKKFAPFVGLGLGVASGTIHRDGDAVPDVTGSAVYFGLRLGADYLLSPGVGMRPELEYSTSLESTKADPATLSQFSLQLGIYFML